jgi:hypothetical protein
MLAAAASVARLDLVADAGALSVGVDAAETIQASNSLEKMLAHQMGVAHTMAMKFAVDARVLLQQIRLRARDFACE